MKLMIKDPEKKVYDCVKAVYETLKEKPEIPEHILPFHYYEDRGYYKTLSDPPIIFSDFDDVPTFQKIEDNFIYYTATGKGKYTFSPDGTIIFEGYRGSFAGGCGLCGMSIIWKFDEDKKKLAITENINYCNVVVLHPWGVAEDFCFYDVEIETSAPDELL